MAAAKPSRKILFCEDRWSTFAELDAASCRWANVFASNLEIGDVVAIMTATHADRIAAMIGAMQVGVIAVLFDPAHPDERLRALMFASGARAVAFDEPCAFSATSLARKSGALCLPSTHCTDDRRPALVPDDSTRIVALSFTSGSTGQPKGVMLCSRRLMMNAYADRCDSGMSPDHRFAMLAPICNYAYIYQVLVPLVSGAALCAYDTSRQGIEGLAQWLVDHRITQTRSVPTLFRRIMESSDPDLDFPDMQVLGLGGEAVLRSDVEHFISRFGDDCKLMLYYGQTELGRALATVWTAADLNDFNGSVYYDRPSAGIELSLVDENDLPSVGEVEGELVVTGEYLSTGYWRDPELSAATFRPVESRPGFKRLGTGDIFRRDAEGRYSYVGRRDHQVKIRGNRIDLAEVQSIIASCDGVIECAVAARPDPSGDLALVGYLRCRNRVTASSMHEYMLALAPDYMRPRVYVMVDELPINSGGKVDLKALPDPVWDEPTTPFEAPVGDIERAIAELWESLIGADGVGRNDHFFERGGDSMLGISFLQQLERKFDSQLPLSALYENPVLADLAAVVASVDDDAPNSIIAPISTEGEGPVLFFMHGRADRLGKHLCPDMRLYGLDYFQDDDAPVMQPIDTLAAAYVREIKRIQPTGPYLLGGFCFGGNVAYETACQLEAAGDEVAMLLMLDTRNPRRRSDVNGGRRSRSQLSFLERFGLVAQLARIRRIARRISDRVSIWALTALGQPLTPSLVVSRNFKLFRAASKAYTYRPYSGRGILVVPQEPATLTERRQRAWKGLLDGKLHIEEVRSVHSHVGLVRSRGAEFVAAIVRAELDRLGILKAGAD